MPAQHTGWHDNAANGGWKRSRRIERRGRLALLSLICLIAGWLPTLAMHAEENTGLAGGSLSLATISLNVANLAFVSSSTFSSRDHAVRLKLDSRFGEVLKELVAVKDLKTTLPKSLLRKPLV